MEEANAKTIVRKEGWLATEEAWLQDAVLSRARLRRFMPDESTFVVDDAPGGIYGIVDGGFGILIASGRREMALCHVIRRGIWFGHGPILTGKPRSMTFQAVEASHAFHVPLPALDEISRTYPQFRLRLAALSERNYSVVATKVIGDLLMPSTERRIAAVLARISRPEAPTVPLRPWPIRLTQAHIGQMANASRDRVNRALRRFEAAGWVKVDYKEITVTDLEALELHVAGEDQTGE